MAKDPAFLFYPDDFSGGTIGMTLEEKGAYLDLLIYQFSNNGSFTIKEAERVLGRDAFNRVWEYLVKKFKENNGSYFNERLNSEIEKRKVYKKMQSEKGKVGAAKRYENLATATENNSNGYSTGIAIGNGNSISSILNSELVKVTARKVFNDKIWADATGMGHGITRDELTKWMAQFNASLVGDSINDFNEHRYKKMFGGWLNKQKSKGYKLPEKERQFSAPLKPLN